jgi:hypothetical protein
MSIDYRNLAKEVLSEYPCSVHICINPYYWLNKGIICDLGDFKPTDVDRLAKLLDEVSEQIYKETGYYISSIDWFDIFPEDKSLLEVRNEEATKCLEALLSSL